MSYIIGTDCSACHYCALECPENAIRFVGLEYAIDAEKCIECGICARVCPSGIIYNPKEHRTLSVNPEKLVRKSADLVVLGGGGSGMVAAVKATQLTNKKVIVLEKSKRIGGSTYLAHAFLVAYSKWHRAAGIPDKRDEFIEAFYKGCNGTVNYNLLKKATYALSDMFDWLCEFGEADNYFKLKRNTPGTGMAPRTAFGFVPEAMIDFPNRSFENLKCTDHSMGPGWMGTYVIRKMLEEGEKLGIEICTEHKAVELLLDKNDNFSGVLAETSDGKVQVDAKACIIATGGFAHSKEWMPKIQPAFLEDFPVHSFSIAANTGDGLTMVEKIGGKLDLKTVKVPMLGPTHHPFNYGVVRLIGQPECVMVNTNGKRFADEGARLDFSCFSIMENIPNKMAWGIVDNNTVGIMGGKIIEDVRNDPEQVAGYSNYREQLEAETKLDLAAKKAGTLEELAELINVPPAAFTAEIKKYNEFCARGVDKDFGKNKASLIPLEKPPFYAIFLCRFNEGAEGGIVNDEFLRIVDNQNKPIPGIYTAGDCCCGLLLADESEGEFGQMPWAMASGYLAGMEAAAHIS